jgi:hypothetical protein
MFLVSIQNANRAGILSSLTLDHQKHGRRGPNKTLTLHITSCKTNGAHGRALMSFDLELHANIVNYVSRYSPKALTM